MIENIFAAVVFAVCVVLMVRLSLNSNRRSRFDDAMRRLSFTLRRRAFLLYHWRSARRNANRVAEEAIRRARDGGTWEGNIYRPKSFKGPRKPH
jgi:hypothetical protein